MANPSVNWDPVPVYGMWRNPITDAASPGDVVLTIDQRVTRVDGRVIYAEGASKTVTVGNQSQQDAAIRNVVRAAWRAADQATLGGAFDGTAWDTYWDTVVVPSAIFVGFPATDDPDIVNTSYSVTVTEMLESEKGKQYSITPLLSHLDLPIPGINLGTIEVPPDSSSAPAPMYAKGVPGGVASLDSGGKIPPSQLPGSSVTTLDNLVDVNVPGPTDGQVLTWDTSTSQWRAETPAATPTWSTISGKPVVIGAGADQSEARAAIGAGTSSLTIGTTGSTAAAGDDSRLSDTRTPTDASVTDAKVASGANIAQSKINGLTAALAGKSDTSHTHDYSTLTGTVPTSALPPLAINETNVVASQAAMLALSAQRGDIAIRTDVSKTFVLATDDPTTLANWKEILTAGQVASVAGRTGAVVLVAADISDSSSLGRTLMVISDAASARAAIGAGTSSLVIGTGAGNAKAGNWTPALADLPPGVPSDIWQEAGGAWAGSRPAVTSGARVNCIGYPGFTDLPAWFVTGTDSYMQRTA